MRRAASYAATDVDDAETPPERPAPTLVSLHFLRTALRRRLWVCVLMAIIGLLAAAAFMLAAPSQEARAALMLTHAPEVDSTDATTTDLSLLRTRTVAARTTARLGLAMTPEDFFASVRYESASPELLTMTLTAPTGTEAVRRLEALTSIYLAFRAEQLTAQSDILVDGMQTRINKLHNDVEDLSRRIEQLGRTEGAEDSKLTDTIAQRAYIQDRIETLQQSVEDTTLQNSAVVSSSRILDPPAVEPGLARRAIALGLASGLIGGTALGCGLVLFVAITSNRLWRRADVATALGTTVALSVGRVDPPGRPWRWLPPVHFSSRRRADDRERLAQVLQDELAPHGAARLAVIGLDNSDDVSSAVALAAQRLGAQGRPTTIIDLTRRGSGGLRRAGLERGRSTPLPVLRPRGLAALAREADDLVRVGQWDDGDDRPTPELGDVTLTLADFDPAVGLDHLTAWSEHAVVVVTAGRSSVEQMRTLADEIHAAGLDLRFAALLRTERSDHSSGTARSIEQAAPRRLRTSIVSPVEVLEQSEAR